jgi:DNA-binding XRE family transcriptional regulator
MTVMRLATQGSRKSRLLVELIALERHAFAAKIRVARAVLGWSQTDLALRVGLTQRAIHMLEQGDTEPRRTTVRAIEEVWRAQGIEFEDLPSGGFRVSVHPPLINHQVTSQMRRSRRFRWHSAG